MFMEVKQMNKKWFLTCRSGVQSGTDLVILDAPLLYETGARVLEECL